MLPTPPLFTYLPRGGDDTGPDIYILNTSKLIIIDSRARNTHLEAALLEGTQYHTRATSRESHNTLVYPR